MHCTCLSLLDKHFLPFKPLLWWPDSSAKNSAAIGMQQTLVDVWWSGVHIQSRYYCESVVDVVQGMVRSVVQQRKAMVCIQGAIDRALFCMVVAYFGVVYGQAITEQHAPMPADLLSACHTACGHSAAATCCLF